MNRIGESTPGKNVPKRLGAYGMAEAMPLSKAIFFSTFLRNLNDGVEFEVGGAVADHQFDRFGFDDELRVLVVPVGEVGGWEWDLYSFGFVGCEGDALEAFELFARARDF
jgi:hypothetical protein